MAINPELIETKTIPQLPDLALALENFFAHSGSNGIAGKANIQALVNIIQANVPSLDSSPFVSNTGSPLPNPIEKPTAITFVGAGTFDQTTGADVITTEALNVLFWSSNLTTGTWTIGVEVPVDISNIPDSSLSSNVELLDKEQTITAKKTFSPAIDANTNILLYSNLFTNAVWARVNVLTPVQNDGLDGWTISCNAATNFMRQVFTVVPSETYTFSMYVKRGTMTNLKYSIYDQTHLTDIVSETSFYSLTNSSTYTRVSFTFSAPAGCTQAAVYTTRNSGVTGTFFLKNVQVNVGATADTYSETTSAGSSGVAVSQRVTPTLTAKNNNDSLLGILIEPTYDEAGKTGIIKKAIRAVGIIEQGEGSHNYRVDLTKNIAGRLGQPFYGSDEGYYVFRPLIAAPPRFYLIPNGIPVGTAFKFEGFLTDYSQDTVNYAGFNLFGVNNGATRDIHYGYNTLGTESSIKCNLIFANNYSGSSLVSTSSKIVIGFDDIITLIAANGVKIPTLIKSILNKTTSYTLALADIGNFIHFNSATNVTLTIPTNSVPFIIGQEFCVYQQGAGKVIFSPASGVTIRSSNSLLSSGGQYSETKIRKIGTNEWVLSGDRS